MVVFIEWETYQKHKQLLREEYDHDRLLKNSRLDVYFLVVLPDDHPNYAFTESDRAYWINQFTRTRPNRRGTVYKKGFLQLILTSHEIE